MNMFYDGLDAPGFDAFEKQVYHEDRIRRQQEYEGYLSKLLNHGQESTLAVDLEELLPHNYRRWGEAGAVVVDIALREVPPVALSLGRRILKLGRNVDDFEWPRDMFAATTSPLETEESEGTDEKTSFSPSEETTKLEAAMAAMSPNERIAIAATMFADARRTALPVSKASLMRWKGKSVKFDGITKIHTNYHHLLDLAKPFAFPQPELRQAYDDGFAQKAEELGFPGLTTEHGFEVLRRAPRKIRAIAIARNSEKTKVRVCTEHGALLTAHKVDSQWKLPTSIESIWERTRAQTSSSPGALSLFILRTTIRERVQALWIAGTPILAGAPPHTPTRTIEI